jgi:hypothetical protein
MPTSHWFYWPFSAFFFLAKASARILSAQASQIIFSEGLPQILQSRFDGPSEFWDPALRFIVYPLSPIGIPISFSAHFIASQGERHT